MLKHTAGSTVAIMVVVIVLVQLTSQPQHQVLALQIRPGIGLVSNPSKNKKSSSFQEEIVVFEHNDGMCTGGLVLNCPTPLCVGDLQIPQFRYFKESYLMLGCGWGETTTGNDNDDGDSGDIGGGGGTSSIPMAASAPWFWLHDIPNINKAYELQGANGPLYLGGDLQQCTQYLQENCTNDENNNHYKNRIQFFRKYKLWQPGQLQNEIDQGYWNVMVQDPKEALTCRATVFRL